MILLFGFFFMRCERTINKNNQQNISSPITKTAQTQFSKNNILTNKSPSPELLQIISKMERRVREKKRNNKNNSINIEDKKRILNMIDTIDNDYGRMQSEFSPEDQHVLISLLGSDLLSNYIPLMRILGYRFPNELTAEALYDFFQEHEPERYLMSKRVAINMMGRTADPDILQILRQVTSSSQEAEKFIDKFSKNKYISEGFGCLEDFLLVVRGDAAGGLVKSQNSECIEFVHKLYNELIEEIFAHDARIIFDTPIPKLSRKEYEMKMMYDSLSDAVADANLAQDLGFEALYQDAFSRPLPEKMVMKYNRQLNNDFIQRKKQQEQK